MKTATPESQGFSLIELSIVIGIMSIMATAMAPNMIAQYQEKLVEATAKTYYNIADAAMAYAQQNGGRWPGYKNADNGCDPVGGPTPLEELQATNYLPTGTLRNPWQKSADSDAAFSLNAELVGLNGGNESCRLAITSTLIPTNAKNMLDNLLTNAIFDEDDGVYSATMQMLDSVVPNENGTGTTMTVGAPDYPANPSPGPPIGSDEDGFLIQNGTNSFPQGSQFVHRVCPEGQVVVGSVTAGATVYTPAGWWPYAFPVGLYCEPLILAD